ncbi:MAG: ChbG/HpnK family deacetylase [Candidatus Dojkabacteria bacterium]|nr:ChbG/HpnK family deacetylase [Candidatus Dojkabacteria bacterium]MDQ7021076.1 ChbG/HpnK family deacetylase [Candidatus Dojkabacteria bacterium]
MKKKVIVTASDFGLTKPVNEGIKWIIHNPNNILTELSLVVNAPGSEHAAEMAKTLNVNVGTCFNLTRFKPISDQVATLTKENGEFYKPDLGKWDFSFIEKFKEEEIKRELEAQYKWFLEKVNKKPTSIRFRKNENGDPKILKPVAEIAKREDIAMATPVWIWRENFSAHNFAKEKGVKLTDHVIITSPGWAHENHSIAVDITKTDKLVETINQNNGISEVVIIAGFLDKELLEITKTLNWQRLIPIEVIKNGELSSRLKDEFELISFSDL